MRAVVTGHAGFIGFHVTKALLDKGATVLGIDGMTDYYDPNLKRARVAQFGGHPALTEVIEMLEQRDAVVDAIRDFQPDVIVHLAAQAGVRYSLENPVAYLDSNVDGTFSVLEAARHTRPAHLLIASTSSVYGGNLKVPFAETDRADAQVSLYAATKKATEALAHSYAYLYGVPTTAFRFFTVYGPWGRPDMALFKFVDAMSEGRPIDVYGNGEMSRDFTYIDDLIEGIIRLIPHAPRLGESVGSIDSLSPVAPFRAINLGAGRPVGLETFIKEVESALGVTAQKNVLPMQAGDMRETFADPSLFEAIAGVFPVTPLSDGIRSFVAWYLAYQSALRKRPGVAWANDQVAPSARSEWP